MSKINLFLFLGLTEDADIDSCIGCPFDTGFCFDLIQTRSSEVSLDLYTINMDTNGGFDFRFMAINSSLKGKPTYKFVLLCNVHAFRKTIKSIHAIWYFVHVGLCGIQFMGILGQLSKPDVASRLFWSNNWTYSISF